MIRKIGLVLLLVAFLTAFSISASLSQNTLPEPDAGVRGHGAIAVFHNLGMFDINVAKAGDQVWGGFHYTEITPQGHRQHVMQSRMILSLQVDGKLARVEAVGHWNGMRADLLVEARDGNPDLFRIVAKPHGMLPIIYDQDGPLVRGEIVVYSKTVPDALAKGHGAIQVGRNEGRFKFQAAKTGTDVKGSIQYVELSASASVTERPRVQIYVPEVKVLTVTGKTAILGGPGTINGRPASIQVRAVDNNSGGWLPVQDEFHIRAMVLHSNSITRFAYEAGGSLLYGDIEVGSK